MRVAWTACVALVLALSSCGGGDEPSGPGSGSEAAGDGGAEEPFHPEVEATDPCLSAGLFFDGESDCDVVRCPELTCDCPPIVAAGVEVEPAAAESLTLNACVPGAGCLFLVDCDQVCEPELALTRQACEGRIAAAGARGCSEDADCGIGQCREESIGGVCVDGLGCAESGHCGSGASCLFDPGALDEVTALPLSLGSCSDGSADSPCFEDGDCRFGRCLGGRCTGGLEGEACSFNRHCASGFCRTFDSDSREGVCVSGQLGGECGDDGDCDEGLHCTTGRCYSGEVGQRCEAASQCDSGVCVGGLCQSGDLAGRCEEHADCKDGFCVSGRCASGTVLAPCIEAEDCRPDLACVRQRCSDGSAGMPCVTADDCSVLACVSNACSEGQNGATCRTNDQCASDRCANPAGATPGECTSGAPGSFCVRGDDCVSGSCSFQYCK